MSHVTGEGVMSHVSGSTPTPTHTLPLSLSLSHTHTQAQTHTHTHTHAHANAHKHARAQARTRGWLFAGHHTGASKIFTYGWVMSHMVNESRDANVSH